MTQGRYEYRTVPITPASMCRSSRMARRRQQELDTLGGQGWEIVEIQTGAKADQVTVKRPAGKRSSRVSKAPSFWEQLRADLWPSREQKIRRRLDP